MGGRAHISRRVAGFPMKLVVGFFGIDQPPLRRTACMNPVEACRHRPRFDSRPPALANWDARVRIGT
jgi:hypothetical protein